MTDSPAQTIVELFDRRVAQSADAAAIHSPSPQGYAARTWREIDKDVARLAAALKQAGVARGSPVIQIADNSYRWIVTDLAVHRVGGVHVAVHASLSGPQMAFQIVDTESRIVILGDERIAALLAAVEVEWPTEIQFFSYEPTTVTIGRRAIRPLAELFKGVSDAAVSSRSASITARPDDLATILYTSGTTGDSKGVMLSQANLVSNAIATDEAFEHHASDRKLCWLPLSHIFARTCDLYMWIVTGSRLILAESRDTILTNCGQFRPTLINGVPYFFDKVHRHCASQGGSDAEQAKRLVALFGGELRLACSGGAPLGDATAEYYNEHGIQLVQGYGLTESSPVITVSTPTASRIGSAGRAIRNVKVKIAADGEILTKGPHVMLGYWRRPDATADTIRDGWLLTGDVGHIDEDGFLWITGRKKELIVTASGKNIAPAYLERLLCEDPLILQALVVGDRQNYLAALVVPNPDALKSEILARGIAVTSREEALRHPEVQQLYRERISARLADVSHCEQIGQFTLLSRGFSVEHDEMTPTLKLRRGVIQEHFAREIAGMYTGEPCARL
jgi:long-chain acyl-CoA synthetase